MNPTFATTDPLRILLIDDDEGDYILTQDVLERIFGERLSLDWIDNWDAGLETVERKSHDICLVDYRLGAKNGLDLVREAVASGCPMPFILLTGQNDREIGIEAMKSGAADYICKGELTPNLLEKSIHNSLARQR